jgi:hypothetical protein
VSIELDDDPQADEPAVRVKVSFQYEETPRRGSSDAILATTFAVVGLTAPILYYTAPAAVLAFCWGPISRKRDHRNSIFPEVAGWATFTLFSMSYMWARTTDPGRWWLNFLGLEVG